MRICVERPSDLTEENLTKIFRHFFKEPSLKVELLSEKKNEKFIGDLDNFQSEINKWTVRIVREGQTPTNLSFIMKTTGGSKLQKFNSRVQRQFFSECFWYKHALPVGFRIKWFLNYYPQISLHARFCLLISQKSTASAPAGITASVTTRTASGPTGWTSTAAPWSARCTTRTSRASSSWRTSGIK